MFNHIPPAALERMRFLEETDTRDRQDGTPREKRMAQVSPEGARFLALLAVAAPEGAYYEIGSSAGYSTLWLALACRQAGRRITTFELLEAKAQLARETFRVSGVEDLVTLVVGDVQEHLDDFRDVAFCFIDVEKSLYGPCYEAIVPNMVPGGLLAAHNTTSHAEELEPLIDRALNDERVDALVVPICKGVLVCRKI